MAKKVEKPYYQQFQRTLLSKLEDIKSIIEPSDTVLFESISPDASFLKSLESGVTKYPLRYYQKEAIYTLHHIYKQSIDVCRSPEEVQKNLLRQKSYEHIKPLLEKVSTSSGRYAPFIGFEMATGSGKTMLMGASVYYLFKMHNIRNFLIVTPSSTEIYKKTICNFTKGSKETVWHDEVPFKFNLINGDNFKDTKDLYHSDTDANIFIFNIDKFGTNATQTKKNWEGSIWKDKEGNTISLLDFLANEDLIIITDEAHHAQSRKAKSVINEFKPLVVVEFTATAVETETNKDKKNQTIVYKYDIKRFLEDKYGKRVKVLALPGEEVKPKGKANELSDIEKYKLQTFFLVHLLKKKAITQDAKCRDLKCIGFVKVKNEIPFAEKVEKYIKEELSTDTASLEVIIEKAKKEDTETTNLILQMYETDFGSDLAKLQQAIKDCALNSILLHSQSDKLVKKAFDDIQKNKVEIVIFIDMLNEGIDMPNIYSMVVINDKATDFKTSVKQIVGRGVRLNKEQREHDDVEDNDLLTHSEKLHIVCDKGASFEEVVLQIQHEFGLNDKTFSMERGEEHTIENPVKKEKLKGIQIPRIKIDFKRKQGISIKDVIENYDKIIEDYTTANCFNRSIEEESTSFIKYTPESFFTEVDLFTDEKTFHKMGEDQNWNYDELVITDKDIKEIYGRVLARLKPIPDVPKTYKIFQEYGRLLNEAGLHFYNLDEIDYKLAVQRFKDSFVYFYIHYVENEYFELDLDTLDSESNTWLLQNEFKSTKIKVRKKDIENKLRTSTDEKELIARIKDGYYFYGYENSAYDYDKFDSLPEKQLADYINHLIEINPEGEPFWVRNERNIFFEYGTHKYYPDFIFFYNKIIYVIEIKGEAFSNIKKNRLLLELNNVPGIGKVESYKGVVVFQVQMSKLKDLTKSFDEFIEEAEAYFEQVQSKSSLIPESEVDDDLKFKKFIPAYDASRAYKKFIQKKDSNPNGWIEVKQATYPETVFATMVKDDDLGSELKNKWIPFNAEIPSSIEEIIAKEIVCYHPLISDEPYSKKITIKVFDVKEEKLKVGIFDHTNKSIQLKDINENVKIEISKDLTEFKVIGIKHQ